MIYLKILENLNNEKERLKNYVACGQIPDFASYRFYAGQIKGIDIAIEVFKETYKRGDNE